jgi:hypothetical protein
MDPEQAARERVHRHIANDPTLNPALNAPVATGASAAFAGVGGYRGVESGVAGASHSGSELDNSSMQAGPSGAGAAPPAAGGAGGGARQTAAKAVAGQQGVHVSAEDFPDLGPSGAAAVRCIFR